MSPKHEIRIWMSNKRNLPHHCWIIQYIVLNEGVLSCWILLNVSILSMLTRRPYRKFLWHVKYGWLHQWRGIMGSSSFWDVPWWGHQALIINLLVKVYHYTMWRNFTRKWTPQICLVKHGNLKISMMIVLVERLKKWPTAIFHVSFIPSYVRHLKRKASSLNQAYSETASLSLQGLYEKSGSEDSLLKIEYSHNKDLRPDLKQLMFGLGSVDGLPLFADVMNGSTSDKSWNGTMAVQ